MIIAATTFIIILTIVYIAADIIWREMAKLDAAALEDESYGR